MELEAETIQNLKDAGCNAKVIQRFEEAKEQQEQLEVLASYRKCLLNAIHKSEQKLNCLDYLIYKIRSEKGSKLGN